MVHVVQVLFTWMRLSRQNQPAWTESSHVGGALATELTPAPLALCLRQVMDTT